MTASEEKVLRAVQYIAYLLPIIFVATGLPMALKMIGPNYTYVIRTPKTYESAEAWYAVNSLGGWVMVASGLISIAILIWMQKRWPAGPIVKLFAMLFAPTLILLVGVLGVVAIG